ncbi:MAG: nucleoside-triphosphatase [Candidatus Aminicenantales bacterium]
MILILTGPVHTGKTSFLKNLLPVLKAQGIPVSGYLSPSVLKRGRTFGYDLFDIKAGKSVPFLRRKGQAGWQKVGPYFFLPSGLRAAEDKILGCPTGGWLVVDEVGPQELARRGVWPALSAVLSRPELDCLLVVRSPLLDELQGLLGKRPIEVFDIEAENLLPVLLERLLKPAAGRAVKKGAKKSRRAS